MGHTPFYLDLAEDPVLNNFLSLIANLAIGNRPGNYWYIPFVMILFLASPLVIRFIQLPAKRAAILITIMFMISMYIHRPIQNINILQSVVYFFPYYLLGVLYSIHRLAADEWIRKNLLVILAAFTLSVIWMAANGQNDNFKTWYPLEWKGLDVMVIEKILMIALLLTLLKRIDHIRIRSLSYIANASFAIFFLHPWIFIALDMLHMPQYTSFANVIIRTTIAVAASVIIAEIARRVLGRRSQYIIGY